MLFLHIITYCFLEVTSLLNLNSKLISEFALGDELTAKTNNSSFDYPRGIYSITADVSFGSPI